MVDLETELTRIEKVHRLPMEEASEMEIQAVASETVGQVVVEIAVVSEIHRLCKGSLLVQDKVLEASPTKGREGVAMADLGKIFKS